VQINTTGVFGLGSLADSYPDSGIAGAWYNEWRRHPLNLLKKDPAPPATAQVYAHGKDGGCVVLGETNPDLHMKFMKTRTCFPATMVPTSWSVVLT